MKAENVEKIKERIRELGRDHGNTFTQITIVEKEDDTASFGFSYVRIPYEPEKEDFWLRIEHELEKEYSTDEKTYNLIVSVYAKTNTSFFRLIYDHSVPNL